MAWDDWISSLQWPLPNWPSCPRAIIRSSLTLDSQQFAWSWIYSQNWDIRSLIDDKGPRCHWCFKNISSLRTEALVSEYFIQTFTQLCQRRNCFPGLVSLLMCSKLKRGNGFHQWQLNGSLPFPSFQGSRSWWWRVKTKRVVGSRSATEGKLLFRCLSISSTFPGPLLTNSHFHIYTL